MHDFHTRVGDMDVQWFAPNSSAWDSVWVSNEFRSLMEKPSWLRDEVMPLFKSRPVGWFAPPSNARFYFSAWLMNCIMQRTYANPLIQDLYVLHEGLHACTLDAYFEHAKTPMDALRSNEIQVSLETECWVYLRHPQWVGRTFEDLWVVQPHIQHRTECLLHNQPIPSAKEHDLRALSQTVGWAVKRPQEMDEKLWWVRRRMTERALTPSDALVAKYERMADKWIDEIGTRIGRVQDGRRQFNHDLRTQPWQMAVQTWVDYMNTFVYDGLPFGDMQMGALKKKQAVC